MLSDRYKGSLYAIASGLCYGLLGYCGVSLMTAGFSVTNLLFWRFALASLLTAFVCVGQIRSISASPRLYIKIFLSGVLLYSGSSVFYFLASQRAGTGLSMVIFFSYPAIVVLLNALLYGKKVRLSYYSALLFLGVGLILLARGGGPQKIDSLGLLFALFSAFLYALYFLFSKRHPAPDLPATLILSLGCSFACGALAFAEGTLQWPKEFLQWAHILALSVVCTALPIALLLRGLRYISAERAALLSVLEPVFVLLFGGVLLHEQVSPAQLIGAGFMLVGGLLALVKTGPLSPQAPVLKVSADR